MTIDHDRRSADARSTYQRVTPREAHREAADGALIVDIRPAWQRTEEIPGALIIERNHLEWRLDPASTARVEQADGRAALDHRVPRGVRIVAGGGVGPAARARRHRRHRRNRGLARGRTGPRHRSDGCGRLRRIRVLKGGTS